jgi:hypothetical protein
MKLNTDLIRDLLIYFEKTLPEIEPVVFAENIILPGYTSNQIIYHVGLLLDNAYIKGEESNTLTSVDYTIYRLTYDGHEFLEAIKSDTVWNSFQEKAREMGIQAIKTALPIIANILAKQHGLL